MASGLSPATPKAPSWQALAFAAVLAVAALLRLLYVADEGFWFDELWIWRQMQLSFGALMNDMVQNDVHPPLYQLLLWPWTRLFGAGELALRLPSVLFGVAAVAATARLGSQLFDRRVGLWAAGVLACNEYAVYYSQEARSYSLLLLLSVLTVSTWVELYRRATPRRLVVYGLCGAALAYTHVFGVLLLVYLALAWLVARLRHAQGALTTGRWLAVHVAMGLAFAVWLPALLLQASRVQQGFWIPKPDVLFFTTYFAKFAGHRLLGALAVPILGWAAYRTWREAPASPGQGAAAPSAPDRLPWGERAVVVFLVGWFVFMLGVPYVVSVVGQPIIHAKSAISVLAPIAIVLAVGLTRMPARVAAGVGALWLVGSLGAIVATNYLAQNREAWREMTAAVAQRYEPDRDLVVLYHPDYDYMYCYRYYLDALAPDLEPVELLCDGDACAEPLAALERRAQERGATRLWLLKVRASDAFPPGLDARWDVVREEPFNNGVLQELERRIP